MDIDGPFHTNWDCFYSPKTEHVGYSWAAHSSYISSSWWNRITYPFPVSYSPKLDLFNKLSPKRPKQSLNCYGMSTGSQKFQHFFSKIWDRLNAHSRPQSNTNIIKALKTMSKTSRMKPLPHGVCQKRLKLVPTCSPQCVELLCLLTRSHPTVGSSTILERSWILSH